MDGDVSWPALSESTRPVMRSPSESYVQSSGGSPSSSSSQAALISHPPNNATRSRSRNRGSGRGRIWPSHNMYNQPYPPMPPQILIYEVPHHMFPYMLETRGAGPTGQVGVSRPRMDNGYPSQRNNNTTPRRGNYGSRPRGDGLHHNYNHGGRRSGQGRRDTYHLPAEYMPPTIGYMPPPLPTGAYPFMISPPPPQPPYRPFPGQMGFDMQPPYMYIPPIPIEFYQGMSTAPPLPPPPTSLPLADENSLADKIVKQVNYYFSNDNLVKDDFLRSNMDSHGWVPISLIASFPRIAKLTNDISLIIDSLRYSTVVEVQDGMVRRDNEWRNWVQSSSGSPSYYNRS